MNRSHVAVSNVAGQAEEANGFAAAELVNARELARLLAVSERTLYRLKSTGELPQPVILGGSVRWRLSEIRNWIAKGCPHPTKPK
ncbi:Prophage CP4-57 regulatory protein (AlpA) [Novipirellula aureliae]|uniref:Prophage CP4-57 regulatory protein (AlpA) n=1 Tax=Novipirellula aureliae TaxID=2527966 RepID=A0A5C6DR77_9BACT|nr:helix-turn-helix domain-containing protein [Novipirellula aureliae]TWU37506.1 Prophage CP4-57 regulatory protein (AlpA) [Novipirellula aureliae]